MDARETAYLDNLNYYMQFWVAEINFVRWRDRFRHCVDNFWSINSSISPGFIKYSKLHTQIHWVRDYSDLIHFKYYIIKVQYKSRTNFYKLLYNNPKSIWSISWDILVNTLISIPSTEIKKFQSSEMKE